MSDTENLNNSNASAEEALASLDQFGLNDSGTFGNIDTPLTQPGSPDVLTLGKLIEQYQTDHVSSWRKLRYATRKNQETVLRRMAAQYGDRAVASLRRRDIEEMYNHWSADGAKVSMGHSFMAQLRTVCGYGIDMLEDPECTRISILLSRRKFPMGGRRKNFVTAEQCIGIRNMARNYGYNSIALAQAIQFELILRQKDVIGEWVPLDEPVQSDVIYRGEKWLRGLRWEEIDGDLILTHVTSKKNKELVVDLKLTPMILEEIELLPAFMKQRTGPIVISEHNCMPWQAVTFRQKWRMIAKAAGVPDDVFNMDSRSGGITEARLSGVDIGFVKEAATHSDIATTEGYDRGAETKIAVVQTARMGNRNVDPAQNQARIDSLRATLTGDAAHRQAQGGGNG